MPKNAPAAVSASKNARRRCSTPSSRRAWATARPSTRPSRRPCREFRSSTPRTARFFTQGKCKVCSKVCPTQAVDYEQKDEVIEIEVGNIIMATGWKLFDCERIPQYRYKRLENVYTNMEFERLCNAAGPTNGKIVMRDGKTEPKSIAIIHCVGSRDANFNPYCSSVCCMAALKFGHLVLEKTNAEVYSFYIDMRPTDERLRGVLSAPAGRRDALHSRQGGRGEQRLRAWPSEDGKLDRAVSKTRSWASRSGCPSTW